MAKKGIIAFYAFNNSGRAKIPQEVSFRLQTTSHFATLYASLLLYIFILTLIMVIVN